MFKRGVLLVLISSFIFSTLAYAAEKFPSRPITAVVPFGPGGGTDRGARAIASAFEKHVGVPMRVVNMPGAGAALGYRFVAESAPDGYTLIVASPAVITMPYMYSKEEIGWDADDFDPVAIQQVNYFLVIVSSDSPFKNLNDLVEFGRANPGKIRYGSDGTGGNAHVGSKTLELAGGFQATHVPFDTGAEVMSNIMGGHLDLGVVTVGAGLPLVKGGKLRALAVGDTTNIPPELNIRTAKEQGVDWDYGMFRSWMAAKNTPKDRIAWLAEGLKKVVEDPEVRARVEQEGEIPRFMGPEELAEALKALDKATGPAVRAIVEEMKASAKK